MRKHIALIALILCVFLFCCACAVPTVIASQEENTQRALADMRASYRSASLVIQGTCIQEHINSSGIECCDLKVDEVIAGSMETGEIVHCTSQKLNVGASYLMYLGEAEDEFHTEDKTGYNVVTMCRVNEDTVEVGGAVIPMADVKNDIHTIDSIITSPATSYYYGDIESLADAASVIFIGRVTTVPKLKDTEFRSTLDGATVEHTIPAAKVNVTVYGSIKGALKYNDRIKLVYSPAMSADIVDAQTLKAAAYTSLQTPKLIADSVYMFFLMKGPDRKQDYYFAVNPMQGYVPVLGEKLSVSGVNTAVLPYFTVTDAVNAIRNILDQ